MQQRTNRISGKILFESSREGIPDLVVTAVDFDPLKLPEMDRGVYPDPNYFSKLLDLHHEDHAPQRLGSVITDRHGHFEIEFSDDLFRKEEDNPERRPDFILYIQVPDRPAAGAAIGTSNEERLVFHTRPVRFEAGRTESFVILLQEAQLVKAGFKPASTGVGPRELSSGFLEEALAAERRNKQALGRVRREWLEERSFSLERERDKAARLVERLAHDGITDLENYLAPGFEESAIPDLLTNGIADLLGNLRFDVEGGRLGTRIHLTDDEVVDLGGSADGLASGERLPVTLCDVLQLIGAPGTLLRSRDLLTEVRAHREVDRLADVADNTEDAEDEEPDTVEDTDWEDVEADIRNRLRAIISRLPEYGSADGEEDAGGGLAGELDRIKKVVDRLEMSRGPANVVASRDVNILQLGFRWIWTSLFDRDFEGRVRELFKNVVRLEEDHGMTLQDFDRIRRSDDLRALLQDIRQATAAAAGEPVPEAVANAFWFVTRDKWARLDDEGQRALVTLAEERNAIEDLPFAKPTFGDWFEQQARNILSEHMSPLTNPIAGADDLVADLEKRLVHPYSFDVFAPGHVNYGVMLTYRQEWSPVTYQVGELVETLPLAAGETREFTVKNRRKERVHREQRESEIRESMREIESTEKEETDALNKTAQAIENSIKTSGSFNIGIGSIGATTRFSQNFTEESQRRHKTLRELTRKASDKIRREHEVTVETDSEKELEETEKHSISNPNDEITITYLLYELERRYRVASRLHEVQPVVCVPLEMPAPHEITEGWLTEHAWVLREALLDPDLEPLLDYLEEQRAGDLMDVELRRTRLEEQRRATAELDAEYSALAERQKSRREEVVNLLRGEGIAEARKPSRGGRILRGIATLGMSEAVPGPQDIAETNADVLEAKREAAEKALEFLEQQLETKGRALSDAQQALSEATEKYSEAAKEHAAKIAAVTRLQLHVRNNIFHYMHRIWSHQHPDKRFFSLYNKEVPFFSVEDSEPGTYVLRRPTDGERRESIPGAREVGSEYILEFQPPEPPADYDAIPKKPLGEIADIDRPLGFRGNYVIFPLHKCNRLTDAMIYPYIDTYTGVRDPAYGYGYTGEELLEYARAVWTSDDLDETDRDRLGHMIVEAMLDHPDSSQEITLPTGRLFMESIKGDTSLLEDFKLAHRGIDVLKSEEDVRSDRIDTLRRAYRVREGDLDIDPDEVERYVIVKNGNTDPDIDV